MRTKPVNHIDNCLGFFNRSYVSAADGIQTGFGDTRSISGLKEQLLTCVLNTLRLRQNGRHFTEDIYKCILLNENVFVPKVLINNIPTLVPIMAWRRPGTKPLSEPMMADYWLITDTYMRHLASKSWWMKYILKQSAIFEISVRSRWAMFVS